MSNVFTNSITYLACTTIASNIFQCLTALTANPQLQTIYTTLSADPPTVPSAVYLLPQPQNLMLKVLQLNGLVCIPKLVDLRRA